ncbi:hypothetical protein [Methylosinus sp. Sm6]|uniref:hypothetical protein n=1 Tax=Methylosinus sp. Sm6 TaxID=2866948 RepID=UPI001C9965DF|nr:hypothetical protein [Methylosinus sp. Sm6]MBY6243518.1 hypothetical protein [Methylosinus sp. Sm6]
MADASPSGLAYDLRELATLMRCVENGDMRLSSAMAAAVAEQLYSIAEECDARHQQLAAARRWLGAQSFSDHFARDIAIREGVRAGRIIDLVAVLEREIARNTAMRGAAS